MLKLLGWVIAKPTTKSAGKSCLPDVVELAEGQVASDHVVIEDHTLPPMSSAWMT